MNPDNAFYQSCNLCPRSCRVNRDRQLGFCKASSTLRAARAALHFWEEPCISGTKGSGAVFFSGCNLHCVFCQNESIAQGICGKDITSERLSQIFLDLQEKGANNINLVTGTHYVPHIVAAAEEARRDGLTIPFVYNTSSYESVETLKMLEGIVDVWLPDFKYMNPELSARYSHASDYSEIAKKAIAEMVRQQPKPLFMKAEKGKIHYSREAKEGYLIRKGVIVRQLLLPGLLEDSKEIVRYLHRAYGNSIYLSLMSQFTPLSNVEGYPELNRKVTKEEYEEYIDFALSLGVEHGFIQEGQVAEESFIPDFNCEGV